MPDQSYSTNSHLSVAMTTADVQTTVTNQTSSSSSSSSVDFYFQSAVIVIGVIGAAANALVLYAMIASKQHKKQLLIFNQNIFDLCSSALLVVTYALKLCNLRLTGKLGYWLCIMLLSENLLWAPIVASFINLMSITVERYLKVVHSAWSNKRLRSWMEWSAVAFAWIAGVVYNMILVFFTSDVVDGVCYSYVFWESRVASVIHGIWNFVSLNVVVVFLFVFCYGRILVVIRRQAKVMAGHRGPGSSMPTAQTQSHQIQSNVIKPMFVVTALYIIMWAPSNIFFLLVNINANLTLNAICHNILLFIAFFYVCANPFIYAAKFEPVRRILVDLIPWKKSKVQQAGGSSLEMSVNRAVTNRYVKERY